jgi:N-methylhydantoinase A
MDVEQRQRWKTMAYRVAVDTGGTFTDFAFLDSESGHIEIMKVPSTRGNESVAIVEGFSRWLDSKGLNAKSISFFAHSTTVGTNAMLEETGAKTGLLVTEGFRGVYEVGEQSRGYGSVIYDLFFEKPPLLVPPRLTEEIPGRVLFDGSVHHPLDEAASRKSIRKLIDLGVESIAVCLLFSFRNPQHETRVGEMIRDLAPNVNISVSSEIVPQIREYYRLSTTVVNAYLNPLLETYIRRLDKRLAQLGLATEQRYTMRSNGGLATFDSAAKRSVQTVLSGPAAGVVAAQQFAKVSSFHEMVTFDMGGTSTDVALITGGQAMRRMAGKVNRRDLLIPMLDIHTVAAGGGTVAWVDELGMLQVGPRSAGSVPGPVCYGRGGTEATITDANLVLGYLNAEFPLAGGSLRLNREASVKAIDEHIAKPLGLTATEAARGIVEIVNVKMQEAIKVVSSNRGYDLRDFHLYAFGGAGPLHAGQVARDLGMRGVIVPIYPGVTAALGLLLSDVRHDYVQSKLTDMRDLTAEEINAHFDRLTKQGKSELLAEGFSEREICFEFHLDMRYAGQGYELTIPVPSFPLTQNDPAELRRSFDSEHARLTGHSALTEAVEIVNYRLTGVVMVPQAPMTNPFSKNECITLEQTLLGRQHVYFSELPTDTPVYDRTRLPSGSIVTGPAVLLQADTTIILHHGETAVVDPALGHIEISLA